ncbi:Uncharacterised protein [Chlamydia trachomatis]|nr:Uncharacterised protein [Chlamydia trachomatis]CRH55159.1 Uncharacterised protein [Chlamydia trachomatis]SGA03112.1 Uncharacterised protein [Chlamydia abortus]
MINGFLLPIHPAFDTKVYCNEIRVISGITIKDNNNPKNTFFPLQFLIDNAYPKEIAKNNLTTTDIDVNPAVKTKDSKYPSLSELAKFDQLRLVPKFPAKTLPAFT